MDMAIVSYRQDAQLLGARIPTDLVTEDTQVVIVDHDCREIW